MRRLVFLAAFALVASLISATVAVAQEETVSQEEVVQGPNGEATMEAELTGPPQEVEPVVQQADQQVEQPKAMEQPKMIEETKMMEKTQPLPKSGGAAIGSVLLPAAALLLGSGVLAYAVLRRSR